MVALILFIVFVIIFSLIWQFGWKSYAIDLFREELFQIRDNLFDYAIDNKDISFSSSVYKELEDRINLTIRYGYRINFLRYHIFWFLMNKFSKFETSEISQEEELNKKNIKKKDKDTINEFNKRYEIAIIKYMFHTNLLLAILLVIARQIFQIKSLNADFKHKIMDTDKYFVELKSLQSLKSNA